MELYLIRHGLAGEKGSYANDDERPLTEEGHQKTTKVALRLHEIGLRFEGMLTSPLVRAKQTAEILQKAGLCKELEEFLPLSPNGDIQEWVNWWKDSRYNKDRVSLALVGHQPDLGNWAELLVWGQASDKLIFKKAGVIGLNVLNAVNPLGNSELFLLTSPKWLL